MNTVCFSLKISQEGHAQKIGFNPLYFCILVRNEKVGVSNIYIKEYCLRTH